MDGKTKPSGAWYYFSRDDAQEVFGPVGVRVVDSNGSGIEAIASAYPGMDGRLVLFSADGYDNYAYWDRVYPGIPHPEHVVGATLFSFLQTPTQSPQTMPDGPGESFEAYRAKLAGVGVYHESAIISVEEWERLR